MTISANTVWEVRKTGSDSNGGGFVAGSSGTDFSQQDAAQYSVADAVTAGTATVTSATANFGTDTAGNIVMISGGTGTLAAGWYQVISRTNATTIVVDRTIAASVGATLKLGGALLTFNQLSALFTTNHKAFIKLGTYSEHSITFNAGTVPTFSAPIARVIGYGAVRGDTGRPTFQNDGISSSNITLNGTSFENIIIDAALNANPAISGSTNGSRVYNCKIINPGTSGINETAANIAMTVINTEVDGTGGACNLGIGATGGTSWIAVIGCYVHDIQGAIFANGISKGSNPGIIMNNIIRNINPSDTNSNGIQFTGGLSIIMNNTVHNVGNDGIHNSGTIINQPLILNNILSTCVGFGINLASGPGTPASPAWDGNAFFSCTAGNRNNMDDTTVNPVNGVVPYTNIHDVALTAIPFTNATTGDFTLNSTAGGGAACKNAAVPNTWPGLTISAFGDMGAVQAQGSSGGVSIF